MSDSEHQAATWHISVCICTYKRPAMLKRLLEELEKQETDGAFTYSIVVVDNDREASASQMVGEFASQSNMAVTYEIEPRQNIPLARNRAVNIAEGNFIAFIDDDELPIQRWLLTLLTTCVQYGVDGVLGPVKPQFDEEPPRWIVKGKFYERARYPTGFVIDRQKGRTGNVLLKKEIFSGLHEPFRPEFRTGEDQDFFGRMIEQGRTFIWCNEAIAYEIVPPLRWKRTFMLRRAMLRGTVAVLYEKFGLFDLVKSMIAVSLYTVILPFAAVLGQHRLMSVAEKLFHHLGAIVAFLGGNPVKEPYVTE